MCDCPEMVFPLDFFFLFLVVSVCDFTVGASFQWRKRGWL
jgi:hypothetical protein